MSWQWLDTWIEEYGRADQQLQILTAWQAGSLVAGLPLLLSKRRWRGLINVRLLEVVGTGEPEWEEVCGEYSDLVAQSEQLEEATALFATYLQALPWDRFFVQKMLENSRLVKGLLPLMSDVVVQQRPCGFRYRLAVPANMDVYRQSLGRRVLRGARRIEKLQAQTGIRTEIISDNKILAAALGELQQLHQARWQQVGEPGAFRSSRFRRFHERVTARFLQAGWLKLQRITDHNKAILINYNIRFGDSEYYYQSGFDRGRYRQYSLGLMAHLFAIGGASDDGIAYYDFMHSVGDSYKDQYGCERTLMTDMILIKPTLVGKGLLLWGRIRERLKRFRGETS